MTRPRPCAACGINPIAYNGRDFCYVCVPRKWKRPPQCKRCGSSADYFTGGLCRLCHRSAPLFGSCVDCLAWGVTRRNGWRCEACHSWRRRLGPPRSCGSCQRTLVVNGRGFCRLCSRQAHLLRPKHRSIDVSDANQHGQQLFLAHLSLERRPETVIVAPRPAAWLARYPVTHRQLVLFAATGRDYDAADLKKLRPPLADLAAGLDQALLEHAQRYGWSKNLTGSVDRAIRLLLATQDTPGALIQASHAAAVTTTRSMHNLKSVLEVLTAAGMLQDDRPAALDGYFTQLTGDLAEPMVQEFRQWFLVLRDGTTTPPRSKPRNPATIRMHIASAAPAMRSWTARGHSSLREIARHDVVEVLPSQPHRHRQTLVALRAMFRFLKARRVVFTNPTAGIRGPRQQPGQPLPIDLGPLREALDSPSPARAVLAALIAFHGLQVNELRSLRLIDPRDGRLHIGDRVILLAQPARARLAAWLTERAHRWPATINPYLLINNQTFARTNPVSRVWVTATLGISAQAIREDRILHEAIATQADIRRLCDLFGLTTGGAERYAHTPEPPNPTSGSGTQAPC